jgi:hypothetical protein
MALLPGIPMLPFLALGGGTAGLAYMIDRGIELHVVEDAHRRHDKAHFGGERNPQTGDHHFARGSGQRQKFVAV